MNAQTVNGTAAYPAGMTQMQPALAEAQCSVNLFFEVEGYGKAQATGRGRTPQEAAANLKATIDETRTAFAPPAPAVPVAPPSREAKVAELMAKGIACAVAKQNLGLVERIGKAAYLVLSGSVEACAMEGRYTVKSKTQTNVWYDVTSAGVCACKDYEYRATHDNHFLCCHGLSVLMTIRLGDATI